MRRLLSAFSALLCFTSAALTVQSPVLPAAAADIAPEGAAPAPHVPTDGELLAELVAIDARQSELLADPAYRRARRRVWLGATLGGPSALLALGALFVYPFTYADDSPANIRGRRIFPGMIAGFGAAAIVGFGFAMAGVHRNPHTGELVSLRRRRRELERESRRRLALTLDGFALHF